MNNPNGPFAVFKSIVADFLKGKRDHPSLIQALDIYSGYLAEWESEVKGIQNDPARYAEGEKIREDALEGLSYLGEAVQMARGAGSDRTTLKAAIDLARQGELLLAFVRQTADRNIDKLEEELSGG